MNILVVGGFGYIGGVITTGLLENPNYYVTVIDSSKHNKDIKCFSELVCMENFQFYDLDVKDLKIRTPYNVVIWLVGIVPEKIKSEEEVINTNVNYALEYASSLNGIPLFIYPNTNAGYPNGFVTEDTTMTPHSLYSETKIRCEQELLKLNNINLLSLRLGSVYGPSRIPPRFTTLANNFIKQLTLKAELDIFEPEAHRDIVDTKYLQEVFKLFILHQNYINYPIYNINSYCNTKIEMAKEIGKILYPGTDVKININNTIVDNEKRNFIPSKSRFHEFTKKLKLTDDNLINHYSVKALRRYIQYFGG